MMYNNNEGDGIIEYTYDMDWDDFQDGELYEIGVLNL